MNNLPPSWLREWITAWSSPFAIVAILAIAWLARTLARFLLGRLSRHYGLPAHIRNGAVRLLTVLIGAAALLAILDQLGVSATVLWTAFTGFAAVGAVAFFAAWSVLSNVFCALLIFTTRPFRPGEVIELVENGEKPGIKGRVVDINLVYSTLEEIDGPPGGNLAQIPNSLFFQRILRRWKAPGNPH